MENKSYKLELIYVYVNMYKRKLLLCCWFTFARRFVSYLYMRLWIILLCITKTCVKLWIIWIIHLLIVKEDLC